MKYSISPVALIIIAIVVISIIAFILLPIVVPPGRNVPDYVLCANNLKQIGAACKIYSENNNGRWPSQLKDLYPLCFDYEEANIIDCPLTKKQYDYIQPVPDASKDTLIIKCTQHNKELKTKVGLILYKNGRVLIER